MIIKKNFYYIYYIYIIKQYVYCSIIFLIIRILFPKYKKRSNILFARQKKYFSYHFLLNELFKKYSIKTKM